MAEKIKQWFTKLRYNWSHERCYTNMEYAGHAAMGCCGGLVGLVGGDKSTSYLQYTCIGCPHHVDTVTAVMDRWKKSLEKESHSKIIALDFDGTLVTNKYPEVGEPIEKNILKLKKEQTDGAKVILWTSRVGNYLKEAVDFCKEHGIHLDAVNENLPEIIKAFDGDTRKIFANEYWDDRAVPMSEQDIGDFSDDYFWISVAERLPEKPMYDWVLVKTELIPEGGSGVPHVAELRNGVWYCDCCDGPMEETLGVKVVAWFDMQTVKERSTK